MSTKFKKSAVATVSCATLLLSRIQKGSIACIYLDGREGRQLLHMDGREGRPPSEGWESQLHREVEGGLVSRKHCRAVICLQLQGWNVQLNAGVQWR